MSSPTSSNEAEAKATTVEPTAEAGTSCNGVRNAANTENNEFTIESDSSHRITELCTRHGKCKWFNATKGWGFITPSDGGADVFVHQTVIQMHGFRSLAQGEEVEFESRRTVRGLEATRVSGLQGADCRGYRASSRRRIRCYNCDQYANHYANSCPQGPQPKRCHRCKEDTHLMRDCPKKNGQANKRTEEIPGKIEEKSPEENIEETVQPESAETSASWSIPSATSEEGGQPAT